MLVYIASLRLNCLFTILARVASARALGAALIDTYSSFLLLVLGPQSLTIYFVALLFPFPNLIIETLLTRPYRVLTTTSWFTGHQ